MFRMCQKGYVHSSSVSEADNRTGSYMSESSFKDLSAEITDYSRINGSSQAA